jgi:predicted transcriptional regulator
MNSSWQSTLLRANFVSMEVILMSIKPKYAEKIIFGSKTIELRRVAPNLNKSEVILIYESSPVKAITGYAFISSITKSSPAEVWNLFSCEAQISKDDFDTYYDGTEHAFAIHITNATRFIAPISLADLRSENILTNPPQSYRYLQMKALENRFNLEIPIPD